MRTLTSSLPVHESYNYPKQIQMLSFPPLSIPLPGLHVRKGCEGYQSDPKTLQVIVKSSSLLV